MSASENQHQEMSEVASQSCVRVHVKTIGETVKASRSLFEILLATFWVQLNEFSRVYSGVSVWRYFLPHRKNLIIKKKFHICKKL